METKRGRAMVQKSEDDRAGFVRMTDSTLLRELDGETVLLDLTTEVYFSLDDVGAAMLTTVLSSPSIGDALEVLLTHYDVAVETLRADLTELLTALQQAGLIEGQW